MKGTTTIVNNTEIIKGEGGMPQLKLTDDMGSFYLVPFRGYCFQVTGAEGDGDYGSSEVIGLANVIAAFSSYNKSSSNLSIYAQNDDPIKIIFRAFISHALNRANIIIPFKVGDKFRQDIIDEFVDNVIDWLHKLM